MSEGTDPAAVLARLSSARSGISQAISVIEQSEASVQEVVKFTAQRFTELTGEFNELRGHLQGETARAIEAATGVMDALHEAQAWVTTTVAEHQQALTQLQQHATTTSHRGDEVTQAIAALTDTTHARQQGNATLLDSLAAGVKDDMAQHAQAAIGLHDKLATWKSSADDVSGHQHDRLQQLLEGDMATAGADFAQKLQGAVDKARSELEAREHELSEHASQEVTGLDHQEGLLRDDISHKIDAMRDALSKLGDLVTGTSHTLSEGAHNATELMDATNIGMKTVIGLFDNLSEIFKEIEHAWDG